MRELVTGGTTLQRINRSVLFAWLFCVFCIVGATVNLIGWLLNQRKPPTLFELLQVVGWGLVLPVLYSVLAALIIARQPGNRVGWLLMLPALATALSPQDLLVSPPTSLTIGLWLLLWFDNWSWVPIIFPVFLISLHFPTGRPPSSKWNWVNWLAISLWLVFILLIPFFETIGPANNQWKLSNPIGFIADEIVNGPILIVWGLGLVTVVLASVVSLFVRYRRARVVERQQIKWLLYAGALFVGVYSVTYFVSDPESDFAGGWVGLLLLLLILAFPVAIAIAILRYRLFDIDVIIRKTLVYAVLTAFLVLIYFGSVVVLQNLFAAVSGEQSAVAIVLSTLAIAALFSPLRRRVQGWIDRRFYRRKYDAAGILAAFAETARDEVDLNRLAAELLQVVEETMQPESAGLWLRPIDDRRKNPEASSAATVIHGLS